MSLPTTTTQIVGLFGWIAITFAASAVGAFASIQASAFYAQLSQPAWSPPVWLFGPVWTVLYALMAVAAWLVWRSGGFRQNRVALAFFFGQLVLNALWSWLFFAWHLGAWAFVDILMLLTLIITTIIFFWRIQPLAGVLLVPYLLWVSFASALNFTFWQLNPQLLG